MTGSQKVARMSSLGYAFKVFSTPIAFMVSLNTIAISS
jgi:hypothetical protein